MRLQNTNRIFENLKMIGGLKVEDFYMRVNDVINKIINYGEKLHDKAIYKKIIKITTFQILSTHYNI